MIIQPKYLLIGLVVLMFGCTKAASTTQFDDTQVDGMETATFAGGCFWCMEGAYEALEGVSEVVSGYTGGNKDSPTYKEVTSGKTGHFEAVKVVYDPEKITYKELVDYFWRQVDPTDAGGQFADRGSQYKTAIFYHNEQQKKDAQQSKKEIEASGKFDKPIVTEILPAEEFFVAEEYHQDYYKKNSVRYGLYEEGSGRKPFLRKTWDK